VLELAQVRKKNCKAKQGKNNRAFSSEEGSYASLRPPQPWKQLGQDEETEKGREKKWETSRSLPRGQRGLRGGKAEELQDLRQRIFLVGSGAPSRGVDEKTYS